MYFRCGNKAAIMIIDEFDNEILFFNFSIIKQFS